MIAIRRQPRKTLHPIRTGKLESRMFVEGPAALRHMRINNGGDGMSADRMFLMGGSAMTAIEDREIPGPEVFALRQNYPNPFSPSTTITFEITRSPAEEVSLVIYDVLGRRVRTLVEGALSPGQYSYVWNGLDDVGSPVASGLYLYRLQVDDHTATRSMTLIK